MSLINAFSEFGPGTCLKVKTSTKTFKADFTRIIIEDNQFFVTFNNAVELPNNKEINGVLVLKIEEIEEYEKLPAGNGKSTLFQIAPRFKIEEPPTSLSLPLPLPLLNNQVEEKPPLEIQLRTVVIKNCTYFKRLVKLIDELDIISLSLEGKNVSRKGVVSWIVMVAKNTLIPFDVTSLVQVVPNFWTIMGQKIFSNIRLTKVMHDCRYANDYLHHVHGIRLNNVFDTKATNGYLRQKNLGSPATKNLSDLLEHYEFNVPREEMNHLKEFEGKDFSKLSPWLQRPLPPKEVMKAGALKVKYLILLRDKMLERMLKPLKEITNAFANSLLIGTERDNSCFSLISSNLSDLSSLEHYSSLETLPNNCFTRLTSKVRTRRTIKLGEDPDDLCV